MTFQVGDRVKRSDTTPNSIPAFLAMRGRVVNVNPDSTRARIHWDGDSSPDLGYRDETTIEVCDA